MDLFLLCVIQVTLLRLVSLCIAIYDHYFKPLTKKKNRTHNFFRDTANSQKNRFRMILNGSYIPRYTFPQLPWGTLKNPSYLKTKQGNLLLTGGWWKYARKIHYTADLLMAISWGFDCGFNTLIPSR